MKGLLCVRGLSTGYGGTTVLDGVSLSVEPGKMVCVIGPNGAGKSTLMKAIFGLLPLSAGEVVFDGRDITGWPPEQVVRLGLCYVPQVDNTFPNLTVEENLEIGAATVPERFSRHRDRVYAMFPDLAAARNKAAGNLSGGQQRMLALGLSLMLSPRLVLLDEPTSGLAPKLAEAVLGYVRRLRDRGISVLLVEQNARKALQMSDRGYVLSNGKNRLSDTGAALLSNPEVGSLYLGK